jgi:Na+/proline symporter
LTDFLHTTIALILLIYFSLAVLTNEHIGGVSGLYEKVKATDDYIPGNYKGSLLTMKSKSCKGIRHCYKLTILMSLRQRFFSAWSSSSATLH